MIKKIFSIFSGSSKPTFQQISAQKIEGEFYKFSFVTGLTLLSKDISLSFTLEDPEYPYEYTLVVVNQSPEKDKDGWKTVSFFVSNELRLKFLIDRKLQDCLIWESSGDFFIFSNDSDINQQQNFQGFLESFTILISSNSLEIPVEKTDNQESKKNISVIGEIDNIIDFIKDNFNIVTNKEEEETQERENLREIEEKLQESHIGNPSKLATYINFKKAYPDSKLIFSGKGKLMRYLFDEDSLDLISSTTVFQIYIKDKFDYFIAIDNINDPENSLAIVKVNIMANITFQNKENLVMFLIRYSVDQVEAYNFIFEDKNNHEECRKLITKSLYETSNNIKYEELKEDDRQWLEDAFEDDLPDENAKEIDMEIDDDYQEKASELNNKITSQAYIHDRTFVIRENNSIGVYKTDEDDVLTHLLNLPPVSQFKDKKLDISHAHMYLSDTSMMLLDKNNQNSSYRYDLAKGTIVEEWTAGNINKVNAVCPDTKFGQMTDSSLITGCSKNALFTMDGRVNDRNKIVEIKNYKTNPMMETIVTTNFGGIAVGSKNGEIRLYKQVGQNAKTLLPGFGDAIISIDVTSDGKWILATCASYLLLIPTTCKGEKNGFTVPMGKEKPKPRALKLKPIDIAKYKIQCVNFTPAKFNVNQIEGETNIITSTGDFIVNWNFSKVVKGITDDYKIKKANQTILDSQFKFNKGQIVVTMDNKLRIQNQKYFI